MSKDNENAFTFNLNHGNKVVTDVISLPTKFWLGIEERSADNTLPIAMVILWSQFSLSYLSVLVITKGDISFITAALNPTLISTYAFVSIILGIAVAASLTVKYVNKQKTEKKELNEINETAAQVKRIKITPDLDSKEEISIILPISESQETILKKQMKENRNKVILLIAPSLVVSTFLIIGALYKSGFSFANVSDWIEGAVIAITVAAAIAGACILVNKLKNNEVNHGTVKKFSNAGILCPWKNDEIILVMKEYVIEQEKDDPISQVIGILREIGDKLCNIMDKRLQGVEDNLNKNINNFLEDIKNNIKALLDTLEEEVKSDVIHEITNCLKGITTSVNTLCKEVSGDVKNKLSEVDMKNLMDTVIDFKKLAVTVEDRLARLQPGRLTGLMNASFSEVRLPNASISKGANDQQRQNGQSSGNNEAESDNDADFQDAHSCVTITELKQSLDKLKEELSRCMKAEVVKHTQPSGTDSGLGSIGGLSRNRRHSTGSLGHESNGASSLQAQLQAQKNKEELAEIKNKLLKSEKKTDELEKENAKLTKERSQQKEASKRQEKLNGKLSDFLLFVLGSTELKGKNSNNTEVSTTLRSFNNRVEISRIDGPSITCDVDKDGSLQVDEAFDLKNIHAAILQQHVLCR